MSSRQQYISLYLCAADEGGYLAEQNAHRLGKLKVGKSCITFKRLEDLDLKVAEELVRKAAKRVSDPGDFSL